MTCIQRYKFTYLYQKLYRQRQIFLLRYGLYTGDLYYYYLCYYYLCYYYLFYYYLVSQKFYQELRMKKTALFLLAVLMVFAWGCSQPLVESGDKSVGVSQADFEHAQSLVEASNWERSFIYSNGKLKEVNNPDAQSLLSRDLYPDPGGDEHDWVYWKSENVYGITYWIYVCNNCGDQYWVNTGVPARGLIEPRCESLLKHVLQGEHSEVYLSADFIRLDSAYPVPGHPEEKIISAI